MFIKKEFIRENTPNLLWSFLSFLRNSGKYKNIKNLNKIKFLKNKDNCIVLGNGPSLLKDLNKIVEKKDKYDFVCVNNFATSEYFRILRPNKYIIIDSYFFDDKAHKDYIEQRNKTFKFINDNTDWEMQIFLPANANEKILKDVITNKNIEIIKINVAASDYKFLYKTGFFGPSLVNVLIYGIYLSIWSKYKNIEIYGADLSFHNDINVNQLDNSLYMEIKHFNSKNKIVKYYKNPDLIIPVKFSELFLITHYTFKSHEILNNYAIEKGIVIKNLSSYSLIDSYQRGNKNV